MRDFFPQWQALTTDPEILSWVRGYKIPFLASPTQAYPPIERFSDHDKENLASIIPELLAKGVINRCTPAPDQFISPVFLEPKPNGGARLILNLKKLNAFLSAPHFKIEDARVAARLITPKVFLATLDLKDAYYLVPVDPAYWRYLRFSFNKELFEFTCLPFGLCTAPFVFTKLLKPVMHSLRLAGYLSVVYLDDFLLVGASYEACVENVAVTCDRLASLGFLFSKNKCQFPPSQQCQFLGLLFDSARFSVELPQKRHQAVLRLIKKFRHLKSCTIRSFAQFVGSIGACCPALPYAWLYTKQFEREKVRALARARGSYDALMSVPSLPEDFKWWEAVLPSGSKSLESPPFDLEIFSDASLTGWGAACAGRVAHGFWQGEDLQCH